MAINQSINQSIKPAIDRDVPAEPAAGVSSRSGASAVSVLQLVARYTPASETEMFDIMVRRLRLRCAAAANLELVARMWWRSG